jgi:tRNA pseudouridine38/39 synthase
MTSVAISPVLVELKLTNRTHLDISKPIGVLNILQELLTTKVLSEDQLRSTHAKLVSQKEKGQESKIASITDESITVDSPRTRHIALRFYYDGQAYSGLAENMGLASDQSVEKALFGALQRAHLIDGESREMCNYSRCGRTDRGVSAAGQVIALRVKSAFRKDVTLDAEGACLLQDKDLPNTASETLQVYTLPRSNNKTKNKNTREQDQHSQSQQIRQARDISEYAYDKILNNILPPDIRILGWTPVTDEFSARFSATTRTYRYFFYQRPYMNMNAMEQALQRLVGTHDFRNLCKMDVEKVYNFERTIYEARIVHVTSPIQHSTGVCYFEIRGQAFLWHQIRCIAEILFLVGHDKEPPSVVSDLLNVTELPRKPSYPLADEKPLVLHDCEYKHVRFNYSVQNLWTMTCLQEKQWEELILKAARIQNCISSLKEMACVSGKDVRAFVQHRLDIRRKRNPSSRDQESKCSFVDDECVTWKQALEWIGQTLHINPDPSFEKDVAYTPLLNRSMGTTYEEKVEAAQKSSRRKERFETNVVKKRKTKEEDSAFYKHMMDQGSSSNT